MPRIFQSPMKWSSPRTKGGVHNRNGFAVMRFNGRMKATGLKFHADNKKVCLGMLERWVEEQRHPELVSAQAISPAGVGTLYAAIERFEKARYPMLSQAAIKNYERAFAYFVKRDLPLDYPTLQQEVVTRNAAATSDAKEDRLASNTWRKYLQSFSTFYDFVVEQEWLRKNPIGTIGIPKRQQKVDILVYSREEIASICRQVRMVANHEDYALLLEMLSLTGLRISEALALRWIDITEKSLKVMTAKGGRPRILAIDPIPGLRETLEKITRVMEEYVKNAPGQRRRHSSKDNIFWWADPTDPRNVFNEAKQAIGMKDDGRTLHTLRGSAEWWWENDLGWDDRTICDMAGHTSRVRHQHYRTTPTAEELEHRLGRNAG
ncbi:MAG: tyrosine-type recombinase/integrase [Bacteroidota bacterium]